MVLAAKQIGFSIKEIRGLTVGEVLTFIDLSIPDSPEEQKPKKATQADIDALLR